MKTSLKSGFTLIELMIVVAIIGLLAALAIPNFMKFQAKSKQSEARANLKSSFTAEKSYYADKQMYLDEAGVVGFAPESANRYHYFMTAAPTATEVRACGTNPTCTAAASGWCASAPPGCGGIGADQKWNGCAVDAYAQVAPAGFTAGTTGVAAITTIGIAGAACCPQGICEFAVEAVGNIDNDTTADVWLVSSESTVAAGLTTTCGTAGTTGPSSEGEPINMCNDVQN